MWNIHAFGLIMKQFPPQGNNCEYSPAKTLHFKMNSLKMFNIAVLIQQDITQDVSWSGSCILDRSYLLKQSVLRYPRDPWLIYWFHCFSIYVPETVLGQGWIRNWIQSIIISISLSLKWALTYKSHLLHWRLKC